MGTSSHTPMGSGTFAPVRWPLLAALVALACTSRGATGGPAPDAQAPAPDAQEPADTGGGAAACTLTNITSATTQSCYDCMRERCCAEMQACDNDPDCVFCIDNPIDSSERCVDPNTFMVYPNRRAIGACQTERCVPPCGASGGSRCVPGDCVPSCYNYSRNCR